MTPPSRRPWTQHLLAVAAALHVLVVVGTGLGTAPTRDGPTDRTALAHWSLGSETVEDALVRVGARWNAGRRALLTATGPYARCCGTRQFWGMFAGTYRRSSRIEVAVKGPDGWRDVYVEGQTRDAVYGFYRFRHLARRIKSDRRDGLWTRFVASAGARALAEHEAASAARVRVVAATIPKPGSGEGRRYTRVVKSGEVAR